MSTSATRGPRDRTLLDHAGSTSTDDQLETTRYGAITRYVDTKWRRRAGEPVEAGLATEFYLGTGHVCRYTESPVPIFLSMAAMERYHTTGDRWPIRAYTGCRYALDSGAYTALTTSNPNHPWHRTPDDFGGMAVRIMDEIGLPPEFAAPQDYPCEPPALAATGLTVRDHVELTVASYLYLRDEFPMIPWIPVLQGWEPDDYRLCAELYERAGVDLAECGRVGLGSVCRRADVPEIAALVREFAGERGYRLHGFGVSIEGLRVVGHLLASSDSQAWSLTARREGIMLPGCLHLSKPDATGARALTDCRNCFRYALAYREEVIEAIRTSARAAAPAPRELAAAA